MPKAIRKTFMRLIEDYYCDGSFYDKETCFIPAGSEGVIINEHTISLLPNLSDQKYSEFVHRDRLAKESGCFLLLINGRLITESVNNLEHVRSDPPSPIFEDEEDHDYYINELFESLGLKNLNREDKNGSS